MRLLIDGMNVIGARPDGWWRDRDGAVRALVGQLARWRQDGDRLTVVFDGRPLGDLPEGVHDGVEVAYARRSGADAADDRIADLAGPGVVVVTSDRALVERVRRRGGEARGASWLRDRLDQSRPVSQPSFCPPDGEKRTPSTWVRRFAPLVPVGGIVLDVACGRGRHSWLFAVRGHPVVAVDRDVASFEVASLRPQRPAGAVEVVEADLEDGKAWPLGDRRFAAVVVTNYLHRPLFSDLVAAVDAGGLLLYETFTHGQERIGKPANPEHLLRPGELLDAVRGELRVLAFEDGEVAAPRRAQVQRLCAWRPPSPDAPSPRLPPVPWTAP